MISFSHSFFLLKQNENELNQAIQDADSIVLLGVTRALHIKIHLQDLDVEAVEVEQPRFPFTADVHHVIDSRLIVQSFLAFLHEHGVEKFSDFLNNTLLR